MPSYMGQEGMYCTGVNAISFAFRAESANFVMISEILKKGLQQVYTPSSERAGRSGAGMRPEWYVHGPCQSSHSSDALSRLTV